MHAFDRQTDGQTDRNLIVKTALHSMQRGKNYDNNIVVIVVVVVFLVTMGSTALSERMVTHVKDSYTDSASNIIAAVLNHPNQSSSNTQFICTYHFIISLS